MTEPRQIGRDVFDALAARVEAYFTPSTASSEQLDEEKLRTFGCGPDEYLRLAAKAALGLIPPEEQSREINMAVAIAWIEGATAGVLAATGEQGATP